MVRDFAKSLKNPEPQVTVPITNIHRNRALFDAVFRTPPMSSNDEARTMTFVTAAR